MAIMDRIAEKLETAVAYMPAHYNIMLMKVSKPFSYSNEYGEGSYDLQPGDPILEGTRGEHWSPSWKKICKKYLRMDGSNIDPESLPSDTWIIIQTNPDQSERRKSITWAIDPKEISDEIFEVEGGLMINPEIDMLCMGGDEEAPTLEWGCWPVKVNIFIDTYELVI